MYKLFFSGTIDTDSAGRSEQPAESGLLTGTALESSVTELMSLGYTRDQVLRALNASFHNADRAAEYLLSVCLKCFKSIQSTLINHMVDAHYSANFFNQIWESRSLNPF